jgi:hypothetical protein
MKKVWLNNKQPDENGDIVLVIENSAGHRVSTFKGKTIEEVTDALADAQVHANRQLGRILRPDTGRQPLQLQPREITSADRLRYSTEITDPNRVVEVVDEIITARQGATPATVAQKFAQFDKTDADTYYLNEANAFMADYPEYYAVPENQQKLFTALQTAGYDLTRNNLALVFQQLWNEGKLVMPPTVDDSMEEEPTLQPVAVAAPAAPPSQPAPRSVSTGLRNSDANGSKPAPRSRTPMVTRADLERMSRAEYNERLRDPVFRRAVDALA